MALLTELDGNRSSTAFQFLIARKSRESFGRYTKYGSTYETRLLIKRSRINRVQLRPHATETHPTKEKRFRTRSKLIAEIVGNYDSR